MIGDSLSQIAIRNPNNTNKNRKVKLEFFDFENCLKLQKDNIVLFLIFFLQN